MRNLAIALLRVCLFLAVWALLVLLAERIVTLVPAIASLTGGVGALRGQLCRFVPALLASLLFGFIDGDAHDNGPLQLGRADIMFSVATVAVMALAPALVLLCSGACSISAPAIPSAGGLASGLGVAVPSGAAEAGLLGDATALSGIGWWVIYLLALAATEVTLCCGYPFALVQARVGDAPAVLLSVAIFMLVSVGSIPASWPGIALLACVALVLALQCLVTDGLLAPLITRFGFLLVARLCFGVVATPSACPSLLPLAAGAQGSLFGTIVVAPNITLCFLLFALVAVAMAAFRAWRTRP